MNKFAGVLLLGLIFSADAMSRDLGFRYKDGVCVNERGEKGLNPGHLGQCGDLAGVRLSKLDLGGMDLSGTRLTNADLQLSSLREATIQGVDFERTVLSGVDFSDAKIRKTNFKGSTLKEIQLGGAEIIDSNFTEVNFGATALSYVRFEGCNLEGAQFVGGILDGAEFMGGNLAKSNFLGADLTDATFDNVLLKEANFSNANLQGATLKNVIATKIRLKGTNLKKASLDGADLTEGDLRSANLTDTSVKGTIFTSVRFNKRTILPFTDAEARGMLMSKNEIALYYNKTHVEVVDGNNRAEASNIYAHLKDIEDLVRFEDYSAAGIDNLASSDTILFPEFELRGLGPDLTADAAKRLKELTEAGARVVLIGVYNGAGAAFLDKVYGMKFTETTTNSNLNRVSTKDGIFDSSGIKTLPPNNATACLQNVTSPSISIFTDGGTCSGVVVTPMGAGELVYVGYDWYDAKPVGSQDGGWLEILDYALKLKD